MKGLNNQRGVAALFYIMLVPPLFGLYSLGTDGALMIQKKARMNEALESATLAVAAKNDPNEDPNPDSGDEFMGSAVNLTLAEAYVAQYMGTATDIPYIKVIKRDCEDIPECVEAISPDSENPGQRYYQYEVLASATHETVHKNTDTITVSEYSVSSSSKAEKYQGLPVDVVFVADFSGSMADPWDDGDYVDGEKPKKHIALKETIESVTDELQKYNDLYPTSTKHRVAIVPYSYKTVTKSGGSYCLSDQLRYTSGGDVDFIGTISNAFTDTGNCTSLSDANFYDVGFGGSDGRNSFSGFNSKVAAFETGGYTASYQGLLKAAQRADANSGNPRRLIIILSDGKDKGGVSGTSYSNNSGNDLIAKELYGANAIEGSNNVYLCDKIRNQLDSMSSTVQLSGKTVTMSVKSTIAVIGFDYDVDTNIGLKTCAGEQNVYEAQNADEIKSKILELISEEIGHLR
jgi:tight adherence protein G